jgi:hypothetical protein
MTSPVTMSLEDSMTVMFMVPKKFNKETLPKPSRSRSNFDKNQQNCCCNHFGGCWADDTKIEKYKKIKAALRR